MMKRFLVLVLALSVLCLPMEARRRWIPKAASGGGGTNNVTVLDTDGNNANNVGNIITLNGLASVTAGDSIVIGVMGINVSGGLTFSAAGVTQTAGTATIGTVSMDHHDDAAVAATIADAIFRVPITGSGSITIQVAASATAYLIVGAVEAHNLNATPFDTGNVATGTGAVQSTGTITTSALGLIIFTGTELAGVDFVRTGSDTPFVFNIQTGSSDFTGCVQYRITSSNSNTMTDTTGAVSNPWQVSYGAYKTN